MRALTRLICAYVALVSITLSPSSAEEGEFVWSQLPDLPAATKGAEQSGLAGLFGGVHNGVLILAGGANFPDAVPWKNGVKTYWNDIYVMEMGSSGSPRWVPDLKAKLPKPIAYGASVSTDLGVVCIGGADSTQCYSDVLLLKWDPKARKVDVQQFPPLPAALAHSTAARIGNVIYVAGGVASPYGEGSKAFFSLDLEPKPLPKEPETKDTPSKTPDPLATPETKIPAEEETEKNEKNGASAPTSPSPSDGKVSSGSGKEIANSKTTNLEESGSPDLETESGLVADPSEPKPIKPEVIDEPEPPGTPEKANPPKESKSPDGEKPDEESPPLPATLPLEWKELPPWDGDPRAFAVSAAQSDGEKICFFLFSGRNPKPDGTSELLVDAHKFDPKQNQWVKFPDIALPDQKPRSIVAASASAHGDRAILVYGGDDGTMAKVSALIVAAANSTSKEAYLKLNETILDNHPGYSRDVLSLDTIDGIWTNIATFTEACPVTTPAVLWEDSVIIPSGETRPGIRSPKIWQGTWKPK